MKRNEIEERFKKEENCQKKQGSTATSLEITKPETRRVTSRVKCGGRCGHDRSYDDKGEGGEKKERGKKRKEEKKNTDHSPVNFYENGRPVFASEP